MYLIYILLEGGIHDTSTKVPTHWYRRKLTGWIHSHLVPEGFRVAVEKKCGNFIIIRSVKYQSKQKKVCYLFGSRRANIIMKKCLFIPELVCIYFLVVITEAKVTF